MQTVVGSSNRSSLGRNGPPSWTRPALHKHQRFNQLSRDKPESLQLEDTTMEINERRKLQEKILQLDKTIAFIRSQHTDTLAQLHSEIDKLKIDNRELNFKLVMCRCGGQALNALVRDNKSEMAAATQRDEEEEVHHNGTGGCDEAVDCEQTKRNNGDGLTLHECKAIIQELRDKNEEQTSELNKLKIDLQDMLFSEKWTQDAYQIAKSYITPEHHKNHHINSNKTDKLPEIHYKIHEYV
jgi:hypothetical protein